MADVEEDPSSRFVDYTNETDWERFISGVEDTLLQWGLGDQGAMPEGETTDKLKVFAFHHTHYLLRLHREDVYQAPPPVLPTTAPTATRSSTFHYTPTLVSIADPRLDLTSPPESLHRYFGCDTYLLLYRYHLLAYNDTEETITMETTAGVRDDEVHVLLSSFMVALGNCNCTLPAFVVIGDLDNQHFKGVAASGLHSSISIQFDTNKAPEVPTSQHCVSGLLDLFRFKLDQASSSSDTFHSFSASVVYHYDWHPPPPPPESSLLEWRTAVDLNHSHHKLWKYLTWGPVKSPLVSLALQTGWTSLQEGMYVDNAVHSTLNPMDAPTFLLTALLQPPHATALPPMAQGLQHLMSNLQHARAISRDVLVCEVANAQASSPKKSPSRYQSRVPAARAAAVIGQAIGSWVSPANAEIPAMLAAVLDADQSMESPWCLTPTCLQHAVVVGQLVSRLALQMARLEDLQTQCQLWVEFVRALRDQWSTQQLLPYMGLGRDGMLNPLEVDPLDGISMPNPDFHFNLLHQKLQLLNVCIVRRVRLPLSRRHSHATDDDDEFFDSLEELPCVGVLKSLEGQHLLHHPSKELHVPVTQDPVPLTEDIAKEQQDILAKLGVSAESTLLRQQIQSTSMLSDMQAFKAANPQSCLADFIRWYSPRDWSEHDEAPSEPLDMKTSFPQGHLSSRMSHQLDANPWQLMWASAAAVPADKQKPLFDAATEAEKLFHYFETMAPATLLYHMVVATLSNLSVFWQNAMGHDWLVEFPVFVASREHFQAKCNKAIAALDGAAVDEINQPTAEHQVLQALAQDACEKAVDALAQVESTVAALTSLRHVLPDVSASLINDMVVTKAPVVVSERDRPAVTNVVWAAKDANGPLHRFPVEREYVLRHTAPRPFLGRNEKSKDVLDVVSRLYANFTPHEVRYALVLAETEF